MGTADEMKAECIGRRYEWRDTQHGPQLWSLERGCWALWYGVGAIGIADYTKAEIDAALNPCWGAADESLAAERERNRGLVSTLAKVCGQVTAHRQWLLKIDELLQSELGGFYESADPMTPLGEARRMIRHAKYRTDTAIEAEDGERG